MFVFVAFFALGGFDIYLALDDTRGNTYSEVIREWAYSMRWLPFAVAAVFGVLLTHWFVKPYDKETTDPGIPSAKAAFKARSLQKRLMLAGALLAVVALSMVVGFWW